MEVIEVLGFCGLFNKLLMEKWILVNSKELIVV